MSCIVMICGPMGAGKTTHARRLAAETGALRFSIDEWMARLFLADLPPAPDFAWIGARVLRCHAQIWAVAETGALRFSIDEWMARLFLADLPPAPDFAWIGARVLRCHAQIWAVAEQAAARGLPVILDLGFTSRAERDAMRQRIAVAGHEAVLLHLTAPRETRQARIRQRNAERGDTYAFTVTDGMFAALDARFEPPQPDEYPRAAA